MSEQPKKTLWHSELVALGEVTAEILSDVVPSKYQGKPPWVSMRIDGAERYYNCENEQCGVALGNLKGKTVTLLAQGGRDIASIAVTGFQHTKAEANELTQRGKLHYERPTPIEREDHNAQFDPVQHQTAQAGQRFRAAWVEAAEVMKLLPEKDAEELSTADWYDLKLRIAQGIAIEVNRHLR